MTSVARTSQRRPRLMRDARANCRRASVFKCLAWCATCEQFASPRRRVRTSTGPRTLAAAPSETLLQTDTSESRLVASRARCSCPLRPAEMRSPCYHTVAAAAAAAAAPSPLRGVHGRSNGRTFSSRVNKMMIGCRTDPLRHLHQRPLPRACAVFP